MDEKAKLRPLEEVASGIGTAFEYGDFEGKSANGWLLADRRAVIEVVRDAIAGCTFAEGIEPGLKSVDVEMLHKDLDAIVEP